MPNVIMYKMQYESVISLRTYKVNTLTDLLQSKLRKREFPGKKRGLLAIEERAADLSIYFDEP